MSVSWSALSFSVFLDHPSSIEWVSIFVIIIISKNLKSPPSVLQKWNIWIYVPNNLQLTTTEKDTGGRRQIRKSTTNNKQTRTTNKQTNKIYFINRRRREWKKVSSVTIYNVFLKAISTSSCLRMLYACIIGKNRTTFLQTLRNI